MVACIVCDVLGEKNNGTTLAATNLIDYLKSRGHEVRVVCCDKDKNGKENYYVTPTFNFGKILNKVVENSLPYDLYPRRFRERNAQNQLGRYLERRKRAVLQKRRSETRQR